VNPLAIDEQHAAPDCPSSCIHVVHASTEDEADDALAGIHGRPYTAWDGVNQGPDGSGGGYCPHGANTFPTWHRPFLVLFEVTTHFFLV
jgi:tyrosinase